MRLGTIALLAGVLALLALPAMPPRPVILALPVLLALAVAWPPARLPALFGAGFVLGALHAQDVVERRLPPALERVDLPLSVVITDVPRRHARGLRLEARVTAAPGHPRLAGMRVRLSWYGRPPEIVAGERWSLGVRLKRPSGFRNPGGLDYERWLFQRAIHATGYVRKAPPAQRLAPAPWWSIDRWRQALAGRIETALGPAAPTAMITALAVGLRDGLDDADWDVLRDTGTAHLMAISGLHVGLAAGLGYWLGASVWRGIPRLAGRIPAARAGAVAGVVLALVYAALAGFSVPTRRALVMVAVAMLAVAAARPAVPSRTLALALAAVLALEPLAVLSPGFWLSFGAVGVILLGMQGRIGIAGSRWWRWGRVHGIAALGLAPVLLAAFGEVPLLSPLANALAVPWVSLVVVPLTLAGTAVLVPLPGIGAGLLGAAGAALDLCWRALEVLAGWSTTLPAAAPPWAVAAGMGGVLLLLAPRGLPGRGVGLVGVAALLLAPAPRVPSGTAQVHVLDVGQGLAVVARTATRTLVYDAGPRYGPGFDAGRAVVAPFLASRGIARIDRLVISHGDEDHAGGARSLLARVPVTAILAGEAAALRGEIAAGPARPPVQECRAGQSWQWDGVRFEMLHPAPGGAGSGNDASCVLRIATPGAAVLLPGDIEAAGEAALVARAAERLAADLIVAPHHGSTTSSSPALVAAVRPRHVVYSAGYRNRFGFPRPEVAARYRAIGAREWGTPEGGALGILLGPAGLEPPVPERAARPRLWQRAPLTGPTSR